METLIINTNKSQLNRPYIHAFISNTYWAKGRTPDEMNTCIENSLNVGVYLDERQIGYARVVTDRVQFAYLMDVFIDPDYREKGYSKALMEFLLHCDELCRVKVWRLATSDAHGLYAQFGFKPHASPEKMMEYCI